MRTILLPVSTSVLCNWEIVAGKGLSTPNYTHQYQMLELTKQKLDIRGRHPSYLINL